MACANYQYPPSNSQIPQTDIDSMNLWIILSLSFAVSTDCPAIVNFASGLQLGRSNAQIMSNLKSDCCNATGVDCTNNRITKINWSSMDLVGNMESGSLPDALTELYLENNFIVGKMPNLPNSLESLGLYNNSISGPLPSALPLSLTLLRVQGNSLTGDVPKLPKSLKFLWLGTEVIQGNKFTGVVILDSPQIVCVAFNSITDVKLANSTGLTSCDISNNPLVESIHLDNLKACKQVGLYKKSEIISNGGSSDANVQGLSISVVLLIIAGILLVIILAFALFFLYVRTKKKELYSKDLGHLRSESDFSTTPTILARPVISTEDMKSDIHGLVPASHYYYSQPNQ